MKIWPQFVNANPAIVTNVQFRKALMYALNREEMVAAVSSGLGSVAHTVILPNDRELAEVDSGIIKYEYDARRATDMIQALGYSKGPDGTFVDGSGQRLSVEISSTNEDQNTKPMFATTDYWRRIGVGVDPVVIPIQRQRDREYRATFPAFTLQGGASGTVAIKNSHGSQARMPETDYTGSNYSRYINPEFDALIDRYLTTVPWSERMNALRAVVRHMSDQLNQMPLYYQTSSTMISNRVTGVGPNPSWNSQAWDVKS
jgi:peptide/nickel transport system substrate-binding protein